MQNTADKIWRKCSRCKKDIEKNAKYYECSVTTCTHPRTGYAFCSIGCWEAHVPGAKHRDAAAIEKRAPNLVWDPAGPAMPAAPARRIAVNQPVTSTSMAKVPIDVLVVVSKVKDYIKAKSDMNTSDSVKELLSEKIRQLCDDAIDKARSEGRKTVMDRDF
jgi:histone H3/H4